MLVVVIILALILLPFLIVVLTGAPYVPTFTNDIKTILREVKLPKDAVVIDLGSGDGRMILLAAQKGYTAIGYEINPFLWLVSLYRLRKYPKAKTCLKSLWKADVSQANLVFTFLNDLYSSKLEKKLLNEMPSGSYFVSYAFAYKNMVLVKKLGPSHLYKLS